MRAQRYLWLGVLGLGAGLTACVGGRGSSGFDISENAAIGRALDNQECVDRQGLTICPADRTATPGPPASPTATASPTLPLPTPITPTPTVPRSPTPTATLAPIPRVDTALGDSRSIACIQDQPAGPCRFTFSFAPRGLPEEAMFRVVSRAVEPQGVWQVGSEPIPSDRLEPPSFDATIIMTTPLVRAQFAVLVFLTAPPSVDATFDQLLDTGADYAFVTQDLLVNVIRTFPTPVSTDGPQITYFGVARADDVALSPEDFDLDGRPVYGRASGSGLSLVIEARPGSLGSMVGLSAFDQAGGLPDLQLLVSRPLGDGSPAVCDKTPPDAGGVPATDPLQFAETAAVTDAINDLGCRVNNGAGSPLGRIGSSQACTRSDAAGGFGFGFVDPTSTVQFCLPIAVPWAFPDGDTIVAARLRGADGNVGLAQQIVLRIGGPIATATPTPPVSPTPTTIPTTASPTDTPAPMATGPRVTYFGVARADDVPLTSIGNDSQGRSIYSRPTGQGMFLIIEAQPGGGGRAVGTQAFDAAGGLPDLQLLVSRALGDGSTAVCDNTSPDIGGIPATMPLRFSDAPAVVAAINDLGCRVNDGAGGPVARTSSALACTRLELPGADYSFVDPESTVQYCLPIAAPWGFPDGETIVAARLRDIDGVVGPVREIVIRVGESTATPTRPSVPTATVTPVRTPTAQPSVPTGPTTTVTPTGTPLPAEAGPSVTYLGVARPDDVPVAPVGVDEAGRPIYGRPLGLGFILVIEAHPGGAGQRVGSQAFDVFGGAPDLQLLVSRPLGDGSQAVCDKTAPEIGGVPGTDPLEFTDAPAVLDAMNDLGCRVNDGAGNPVGRPAAPFACTRPDERSGDFDFVDQASTIQYCLPITGAWAFEAGDTIVAARVRDALGTVGLPKEMVIRIGAP